MKSLILEAESAGERLDRFVSDSCEELTRSAAASLIADGAVLVNGEAKAKNYKLRQGDKVEVTIPDPTELEAVAQDIPIDIVYQDDSLVVVNKPKGMVVHPANGNPDGTLVNALLFACKGQLSSINGVIRPGIVHRIDKNTSGLLIVAKSDAAHRHLAEQIKEHSFTREYEAVCVGRFDPPQGTIDAPIGRSKYDRKKMCVTDTNSRHAVTHYETLEMLGNYSYMRFRLETGRTHQIRVHCAYKGHPVYGDDVYGKAVKGLQGQCLHARKIGFIHPQTGEYMEFDSELPDYFKKVLDRLEKGQ